jgi:dipeptidyl-peptidase III
MGITNFLIKEGIARFEEIRGEDGKLENVYVKVSRLVSLSLKEPDETACSLG